MKSTVENDCSVHHPFVSQELILLRNAAYSYKCNINNIKSNKSIKLPDSALCLEQDQAVNALLPLAVCCMFCFTFIAGWILDYAGPKLCSLSGLVFHVTSWILLILASTSFNSYAAAFALMGMGTDLAFMGKH